MFLNQKYTNLFLDTVDKVLNSNTFLLKTEVDFNSVKQTKVEISNFIKSNDFIHQILEQDVIRNWNNYYEINHAQENDINFVKSDFEIKLEELNENEALYHLRTMITVEKNNHNFWSPYNTQIDKNKAMDIVNNFLYEITIDKKWKLFALNTDFGYSKTEKRNKKTTQAYFEGDFGSDSASLIVREDKEAYLLLTNGID